MELELGLKITKTRDDITSISEYGLAKTGPFFQSRETNNMFILIAHLKGYKSNNIVIKINEDGSKISISGEKPIQEMLMVGCVMLKKEVEITGFSKVFKIPDGVILDRIKAKYDEEEFGVILKIVMPKLVKGICGARIEEVKEEEHDRGRLEVEKSEAGQILKSVGETSQKGSKDSEVQDMEDRESLMGKSEGRLYEKTLDDADEDIVGETIKSEIEESKLGNGGRNGGSVRGKVGNEACVAMQTPEIEQNVGTSILNNIGATSQDEDFKVQEMEDSGSVVKKKETVTSDKILDDANGKIIGETAEIEIEESKLEIKDGNGESVSRKVGTERYEVMKKSKVEQNIGASIPQNVGDTSQNKESKVQKMKDIEGVVEKKEGGISDKMLDVANREIIGETIKKEVEEPKFGIEDRNEEKVKEKDGKEGYEVMKTSELEQNVGLRISQKIGDTSQDKEAVVHKIEHNVSVEKETGVSDKMLDDDNGNIIGDTIQKNIEGSMLGIDDGMTGSVEEKFGKGACEVVRKSEIEQNVGTCIPTNIGDTSQDKESEVLQIEDKGNTVEKVKMVANKMLDDACRDIEIIQKDIEESKFGIEDGDGESLREKDSKVGCKTRKTSELDQNLADYTPSNIGGTSQEYEIQQMENPGNVEGKMAGGEPKRMPIEAIPRNIFEETIPKDIERPKIEIESGDQEYVRKKAGKEGFEAMIREEFPKRLPKAKLGESEGLNVLKMQEIKDVKEGMVKRKGKEIEYFVENGDGEELKRMHVETKRLIEKDLTNKTRQEETEKPTKDRDQQNVQKNTVKGGFEVSNRMTEELPKQVGEKLPNIGKGFKVKKMEESKEVVTKEAMAETKTLLEKVKGEKSKKRTEEASRVIEKSTVTETLQKETEESNIERQARDGPNVSGNMVSGVMGSAQEKLPKQVVETLEAMAQDENDKIEYGIVKLKGEVSVNIHVEANEILEEDTTGDGTEKEIREPKLESSDQLSGQQDVDDEGFDGSKRPMFPEKKESVEITQTAEVKKPKMKDITPEFEQVAEKMHETQKESEKVTSKMGIEITPNKGIEKSQTEEISPLPMQIHSKEPHELSWPNMEHEIPKIESMTESQVVADKVTKPSKVSSSSSTQPFEDKEKDKIAASHDPIESPQLESSPTDQQCINKDQEESHGMHQIEEEKTNEQDSQALEEPKQEASGGEKNGTKSSNKLLAPLVMAGSALLVSSIVVFVRHRRARQSSK